MYSGEGYGSSYESHSQLVASSSGSERFTGEVPEGDQSFSFDGLSDLGIMSQTSFTHPATSHAFMPYPGAVPDITVNTAVGGYSSFIPPRPSVSGSPSSLTPDLTPATEESQHSYIPSPNTPYLYVNDRRHQIASASSSPTMVRSPFDNGVKSEVASPSRSPSSNFLDAMNVPSPISHSPSSPTQAIQLFNLAGRGAVVPQKKYRPHTVSDRRRYVEEVDLKPTIFFRDMKHGDLVDGFSFANIMQNRTQHLQGRDDPLLHDCGPSISVRINWPGYVSWSRQIPTRDFRTPPQPVTRHKLLKNVAKTVDRFIKEHNGKAMEDDGDAESANNRAWKVGGNGGIRSEDLVVLRLEHVSKGSWQVQLQLLQPRH